MNTTIKKTVTLDTNTVKILSEYSLKLTGSKNISLAIRMLANNISNINDYKGV